MTRTRVRFGRGLIACVMAGLTVLAIGRAASGSGEGPRTGAAATEENARRPTAERYVVRPGDTLWEVARRRVEVAEDPRPLIAEIVRANRLPDSGLRSGQILRIPLDH